MSIKIKHHYTVNHLSELLEKGPKLRIRHCKIALVRTYIMIQEICLQCLRMNALPSGGNPPTKSFRASFLKGGTARVLRDTSLPRGVVAVWSGGAIMDCCSGCAFFSASACVPDFIGVRGVPVPCCGLESSLRVWGDDAGELADAAELESFEFWTSRGVGLIGVRFSQFHVE